MDVQSYFKAEIEKNLRVARELTIAAETDGRQLDDSERTQVEEALSKATDLKARMQDMDDSEKLRKTIDELGEQLTGPTPKAPSGPAKSIGEAFIKSEQYHALKERGLTGRWTTGQVAIPFDMGSKTLTDAGLTVVAEASGNSPDFVQPDVRPGVITPAAERLTIADLIPSGTTNSNSVRYLEETTTTPPAQGAIDEGENKPAAYVAFDDRNEPVVKLAAFLPVSDEMLEDGPAMASYLNQRLTFFVKQEEERQLLQGSGTGELSGILDRSIGSADASDVLGENDFDAIAAGILNIRVNGFVEPDALVIHPTDMAKLQVDKASTAGNYFSGGPFASPATNPWGLRTVITTAIAAGSALVGAFRGNAQVFRRGGLTVEASNSHSDYFRKNLTAIRAEERLALAVYRPAAFCLVDLAAQS